MQKRDVVKFLKKKGTVVAMSLCLVGAVAYASYYTMEMNQNTKEKEQDLVDLNKDPKSSESSKSDTKETQSKDVSSSDVKTDSKNKDQRTINEMDVDPSRLQNQTQTEGSVDAGSSNITTDIQPTVNFQDDSTLCWPVAGTVLMDYSMDASVYFKTLNQYKYNPALIIGSEADGQVLASAKGIVESIETKDETGTTLTLNIGNDYQIIYGQLKEVPLAAGDVVESGSIIGYVSEPTKYYCEEGTNLYFEMRKDGQPVDPFLYLE